MEPLAKPKSSQGRFFSSSTIYSSFPTRNYSIEPRPTLARSVSPSSTVRFSSTPKHQVTAAHHNNHNSISSGPKKTCICSPTTHPGSFRCSLHKKKSSDNKEMSSSYRPSQQLNMMRSAMTNSLVRIGAVEGEFVKRALAALIRPSSHSLRRRGEFQPRPSRLSKMSKGEDGLL